MYYPLAVLPLAVLLTVGCSTKEAAKIRIDTAQYETDTESVYIERAEVDVRGNDELSDGITEKLSEETDGLLSEFDAAAETPGELLAGNKSVFEYRSEVKYNANNFLSLLCDSYVYTGGAHGESKWSAKNIDLATGEEVRFSGLFADKGWRQRLDSLITEETENNPDKYSNLWEKPQIKESNETDFYIEEDGLSVFYQPYDLSYYARGVVTFKFSGDDIYGYLKEEYKRLFETIEN